MCWFSPIKRWYDLHHILHNESINAASNTPAFQLKRKWRLGMIDHIFCDHCNVGQRQRFRKLTTENSTLRMEGERRGKRRNDCEMRIASGQGSDMETLILKIVNSNGRIGQMRIRHNTRRRQTNFTDCRKLRVSAVIPYFKESTKRVQILSRKVR